MRNSAQTIFWFSVYIIMLVAFGRLSGNYIHSFYFVSFFLPVIIGTAFVFNSVLVEKYLLKRKYWLFALYTFYLLVISMNLEMILVFTSFTLMSYYEPENMALLIRDYRFMPLVMYLIVFLYAFLGMLARLISYQNKVRTDTNNSEDEYITLRSDRKNRRVCLKSILYVESMADYVRIFTEQNETIITRETISRLNNALPDAFLRIHRSYIININYLVSFSSEEVVIRERSLPISRTYKAEAIETLKKL